MAEQVSDLLERCGLNRTEAIILDLLLQEGTLAPSRIAKLTQLKRPTVYAALDNLLQLGVVTKEIRRGGAQFTSVDRVLIPQVLEQQAQHDYDRVRQASVLVQKALRDLPKSPSRRIGSFEIRSLESTSAILKQLEEALLSGDFVAIFDPQLIPPGIAEATVSSFLKKTSGSGPEIREIAVDGPATDRYVRQIKNKNHKVKRLPKKSAIDSDIILYNGNVVVTNYGDSKELSLRIREERLYRSLRTVFELLWEHLRP